MIKNIVLDMGNVCCRWDVDYISQRLSKHPDDQKLIKEKVFQSKQWQLLDAGKMTLAEAEKEICQQLKNRDKVLIHHALYHWYEYFDQFDEMEKYIKKLKKCGYHIYLLSNCSLQFYDYYQDKSIFQYFDGYYISAEYQLLKPSPEIFEDFLRRFHLRAEECLFIDDMAQNVEGARNVGLSGLIYRGKIPEITEILQ